MKKLRPLLNARTIVSTVEKLDHERKSLMNHILLKNLMLLLLLLVESLMNHKKLGCLADQREKDMILLMKKKK